MMVTADVAVFVACKVHKNFSSTFLLGATILLIIFRLGDYAIRLGNPDFSKTYPFWSRIEVDTPSYVFGIISIVLLFQWVQTYQVLRDPIRAMNTTMQSYKSFVAQVVFVVLYSVFIVADFTIIGYDHYNSYKEGTNIRHADKLFVVIQSVLDLTIVLGYVILFVFFLKLIGEQAELHVMKRNVLVFFIFMMVVLTVQLVFNTIFYTTYDPTKSVDRHGNQDDVIN